MSVDMPPYCVKSDLILPENASKAERRKRLKNVESKLFALESRSWDADGCCLEYGGTWGSGGQLGVKQPHVVRSWLRLANQSFVVVGWIMDMA